MRPVEIRRIGIGNFPTPFEEMPKLRRELGQECPKLYIKRDDLTGLALGGNKVRKLDYLLVEALRARADVIVTTCGIQSNWARQTVASATKLGMKTVLILRTAQFKRPPRIYDGNLLLDHILGAHVRFVQMRIDEDPALILEQEANRLRKAGHRPYVLHVASVESPPATVAYVQALFELMKQTKGAEIDWIVMATAGGGTQAGLMLGAKLLKTRTKILGFNVGAFKRDMIIQTIRESYKGALELLGVTGHNLASEDIRVEDGYIGAGYGFPTRKSLSAIKLVARSESIILDPVYTSKAIAGLVDLIKGGHFRKGENVCFLHTGGIPALFAYKEYFSPTSSRRLLSRTAIITD